MNLALEKKCSYKIGKYYPCEEYYTTSNCQCLPDAGDCNNCYAATFGLTKEYIKDFLDYIDSHEDLSKLNNYYAWNMEEYKDLEEYKTAAPERRLEIRQKYKV